MNTCRICKEIRPPLHKYGVRHWAHLRCALEKWGPAFLDKLMPWELGNLEFAVLKDFGLLGEAQRRFKEFKEERARKGAPA